MLPSAKNAKVGAFPVGLSRPGRRLLPSYDLRTALATTTSGSSGWRDRRHGGASFSLLVPFTAHAYLPTPTPTVEEGEASKARKKHLPFYRRWMGASCLPFTDLPDRSTPHATQPQGFAPLQFVFAYLSITHTADDDWRREAASSATAKRLGSTVTASNLVYSMHGS